MVKDKKESRLSFRITPEVSDRIDELVKESEELKDRSEFGTKSVQKYMKYVEIKGDILNSSKSALQAIAEQVDGASLPEVQKLLDELV
ncbi:MAG: hypothetical protein ACXAD7_00620 [Candidatus Kariarchaeaceae archaeon]|jgi:Arc/MetJ-type ribon-helix-helix transcriptional regulator